MSWRTAIVTTDPSKDLETPNPCHCVLYAVGALLCIGVVIWLTVK